MTAPKVEGCLSKREKELVAEIRTLKSRLAGFERKELECKESQERIESLAKFHSENPYPVLRISLDGTILYANKAGTGLLPDEHCGDDQTAPKEWSALAERARKAGAIERMEITNAGRTYAFWAAPVMDANYCNLYGVDITDHKKAEEAHRLLETGIEQAAEAVVITDTEGIIQYVNPAFETITGYSQAEVFGQNCSILKSGHHNEAFYKELWATITSGRSWHGEFVNCCKDGREYDERATISPVRDGNGKIVNFIAVKEDVTKHKRAEARLRESEEKWRVWLEHSPVCTKILDLDFNLQYMSTAGIEGLGINEISEFYGKPYPFYFFPESAQNLMTESLEKTRDTGKIIKQECPLADINGNELWFDSTFVPVKDDEGRMDYIIVVSLETTERKQTEKALIDNRAQLQFLASELVLAEERERNRIALHLHDDICQNLAYSKMKLQMVREMMDNQTQLKELTEVCDTLTQLMHDARDLTFELSSPTLTECGFEAAVANWLTKQVELKHGIATAFTADGQSKPLEDDIRALLFRSVRELLANVVKHSKATHVGVNISQEKDEILVHVEDDGIGFSPDKVVVGTQTAGFGLFSIRERLSHLSGSLEIDSEPGQGCRSILRAPLRQLELMEEPIS